MNIHSSQERQATGGQVFDLVMSGGCASVAAVFGEQAYEALAEHIPEAGVAVGGLGFVALAFTGISIYSFDRFRRTTRG